MKPLAVVTTAVVLAGLLFFGRASQEKPQARAATGEGAAAPTWFKVVFGVDLKDAVWDGSLSVSGGRVYEIESWSFEERDQLRKEERSWTARTAILDGRRATYAEPTRGLLIKVDAVPKTTVKLETKQGTIEFSPREIRLGRAATFLEGRATVEVLGFGDLVAETETDDDFAAIAIDERGHRHVLWQAYDDVAKRDWLLIRDVDAGSSENDGAKPVPVFDAKEFADPHLFFLKGTGKEQLVAVFASPGENQDWDIYAAWKTADGWQPQRVCSAEGSDIHLAADAGTTAACGSAGSRCETETATSTRAATPTASGRTSWLRLRQPPMSGSRRSVLLETEWPGSGTTRTRAGITTSTSCRFSSEPDRTGSDCRLKSRSPLPPRRTSKRTRRFSPMTTRAECGSRTTRPEPTGAKTFAMDRR